jgi:hypothetical protein
VSAVDSNDEQRPHPHMPRRDWIILPLIILVTAVLLIGGSEIAARGVFRESQTSTMACLVANDPQTGVRGVPSSDCRQKIFESRLIDYHFNDCGFRTPQSCGDKSAGVYRVVLVGSSLVYGMHVAQQDGIAARLGPLLTQRSGRKVEIYNEAMQWGFPTSVALRTDSIFAAHPDMILWPLTPYDIENAGLVLPYVPGVQKELTRYVGETGAASEPEKPQHTLAELPGRAWKRFISELDGSRTVFMARHFLYRSPSQFLGHTLMQGGGIDYLRTETTPDLQRKLDTFAAALNQIAARAKAAHVPLVVTLLPERAQTIMIASPPAPHGYDPTRLDRLLKPIVNAHGARYVNMSADVGRVPHAGQLYFSVDEHLPPAGHNMLATLLADALARDNALPSPAGAGQ